MNIYTPAKIFDHLLFIGDTHGNNMGIAPFELRSQTRIEREKKKVIVHVGDYGVGYCSSLMQEMEKLDAVNTRLMEHNVTMYVIRGNHDDPQWFLFQQRNMLSNLIFVEDHSLLILQLADRDKQVKVYCNGGSVSINRSTSTQGVDYWNNENFNCPSDAELLEIPTDLDAIVTHNRPLGCHPTVYNEVVMKFCLLDKNLELDLRTEQKAMKKLFDSIRERNNTRNNIVHYFGHYHWNHRERIGDIAHITLAKSAISEFRDN